ncbi:hypothetical protein NX905_21075 [Burkholderia thailandensis]|nr:hypothetical protein [Burkholderia thailandensis]MCS6496739.1 hypothetical protein [Burkholderia thailandensis]
MNLPNAAQAAAMERTSEACKSAIENVIEYDRARLREIVLRAAN